MNTQDIEGIGPAYAKRLAGAKIQTTGDLLKKGGSAKGREALAKATGFSEKRLLEWVNRADLYRIKGVGSEYADLLEAAGVDTIVELSKRTADGLSKKLKAVNAKDKIVRDLPTPAQVADWIKQAKSLPRAVSY